MTNNYLNIPDADRLIILCYKQDKIIRVDWGENTFMGNNDLEITDKAIADIQQALDFMLQYKATHWQTLKQYVRE